MQHDSPSAACARKGQVVQKRRGFGANSQAPFVLQGPTKSELFKAESSLGTSIIPTYQGPQRWLKLSGKKRQPPNLKPKADNSGDQLNLSTPMGSWSCDFGAGTRFQHPWMLRSFPLSCFDALLLCRALGCRESRDFRGCCDLGRTWQSLKLCGCRALY